MACTAVLDLSPGGDSPMDSACYAATSGFIIGSRGGRVYRCDPNTGAVITQSDYQDVAVGPSSICYDSGTNSCFVTCAAAWSFDTATGKSLRTIFKIDPMSLAVSATIPSSTFIPNPNAGLMVGPCTLKSVGGLIYGLWLQPASFSSQKVFWFQANNTALNDNGSIDSEYLSFAYAEIGGDPRIYGNGMSDGTVQWWDFISSTLTQGPIDTRNRMSIEYAPIQNRFYCPEQFQFIDVHDNTGTFVIQLNTGRSNFNGVNIRFNSVDGFMYVAGGKDNAVAIVNPATNAISIKTGFDLPWDFVFTPTKKFAVQQGAVGLKEIV